MALIDRSYYFMLVNENTSSKSDFLHMPIILASWETSLCAVQTTAQDSHRHMPGKKGKTKRNIFSTDRIWKTIILWLKFPSHYSHMILIQTITQKSTWYKITIPRILFLEVNRMWGMIWHSRPLQMTNCRSLLFKCSIFLFTQSLCRHSLCTFSGDYLMQLQHWREAIILKAYH